MAITALPTPPSRSAPSTFSTLADAFIAALPVFVTEANAQAAALELNDTTDTSASSVAIGTGAKTFTVTAAKSFQPGMWIVIADTAAPSTNSMIAQITSYSGTTLVVNVVNVFGSGTIAAWTISQSVPGFPGLVVTSGKTITCTQDTALDEAVAMSSKLTIPGAWTTPAFTAGDFTGNGAMTWTVEAGDYTTLAYVIIGKMMTLSFRINDTTVGGTPNTNLQILIPGSKTATKGMYNAFHYLDNGTNGIGKVWTTAGGTLITLQKPDSSNWAASTNATHAQGQIMFEID